MTQITPQPGIMDIALYQGGAAHVAGVSNTVKLSSNENPLGPSPLAIAAMQEAAVYGETGLPGLRTSTGLSTNSKGIQIY